MKECYNLASVVKRLRDQINKLSLRMVMMAVSLGPAALLHRLQRHYCLRFTQDLD